MLDWRWNITTTLLLRSVKRSDAAQAGDSCHFSIPEIMILNADFIQDVSLTGRAGQKKHDKISDVFFSLYFWYTCFGPRWMEIGAAIFILIPLQAEVFVCGYIHLMNRTGSEWEHLHQTRATGAVQCMLIGCGRIVISPSAFPLPTSYFLSYCWQRKPEVSPS